MKEPVAVHLQQLLAVLHSWMQAAQVKGWAGLPNAKFARILADDVVGHARWSPSGCGPFTAMPSRAPQAVGGIE